jgi:hypothetical protein
VLGIRNQVDAPPHLLALGKYEKSGKGQKLVLLFFIDIIPIKMD